MNILIRNCIVLPMTAEADAEQKHFKGNIGVIDDKIAFVSSDEHIAECFIEQHSGMTADKRCCTAQTFFKEGANKPNSLQIVDGRGMVAMPGLINLHNHVSMSLIRSYADDMALWPWLTEKIWPLESKLTRDDIKLGAQLGVAEMLLGGTTTFVDMYWQTDMVAEAAVEGGIRAVVSASFIDGKVDKSVADALLAIEKFPPRGDELIEIRVAPHAPYTCSPETIKTVIELAQKHNLAVMIHLSETEDEAVTIHERYGKTPTEYLCDLGLFELPTLAAHCVHLSEGDMDILKENNVAIVHNPQSNMKLASGIAPVQRMIEKGLTVGIGTDGPCSNNDLDMWEEMRSASLLQKVATKNPCALPAYELLRMATLCGAKALGKEGRLGILKEGAWADIILVNLNKPHLQPLNDVVSNLAYCGKASDVDTVIVGGRIVVEGAKLSNINTEELFAKAQKRIEELKKM